MMNAGGAVLGAELRGELAGCVDVEAAAAMCWVDPGPSRTPGPRSCRRTDSRQDSSLPARALGAEGGANGGRRVELRLRLRGAGRFLCHASRRPTALSLDGRPAEGVEWEEGRGALWFSVPWRADLGSGERAAVVAF